MLVLLYSRLLSWVSIEGQGGLSWVSSIPSENILAVKQETHSAALITGCPLKSVGGNPLSIGTVPTCDCYHLTLSKKRKMNKTKQMGSVSLKETVYQSIQLGVMKTPRQKTI